ncbi:ABC transporter ATP-binding protein [Nocardioides donggukensis]|uniref:ATP-binding cassette domain-containing protein n=1 Tax=Nocardioides donggukensis TaxID=2774019 RepID=A0A927K4X6_9ACTN|nr:ATP-binding cassette domain-containing protein [Nocardioides donggukensis]MBD8870594.1 ATP-binding cassette domain-containing protein [Nocardioides donggukensis]
MLSVLGLTRDYDGTTVLDDVSFDVRPGRMTGFVGANGAGKTTTMRIIVGVLAATRGSVTWGGEPISVEQRRRIGYLPEERGLYPKMKVHEQLVYFARLHGRATAEAAARAHELLDRLGLAERAGDLLETLSLGNQQRVQVAAALMHEPEALVMDEPFSGLDPIAVDAMVSLLRDEVTPHMPVLFSSHQLELVEGLCDDLVILSHGRLVAAGSVADLRGREADRFRVVLAGDADASTLRDVPEVVLLDARGPEATVELRDGPPEEVLRALQSVAPVAEFARVVRPLAQIYREAVQ